MLYSPNSQKICLELQQIKKKVLRPHISRIPPTTYDELFQIKETLLGPFSNERFVSVQFK